MGEYMDDEQVNQMRLDAADLLLGSAQSLGFEGKKNSRTSIYSNVEYCHCRIFTKD